MATSKALNADLAVLEGRSLVDELPGVPVALDTTLMLGRLQDALIGPRAEVTACNIASAVLLPGECLVVRYELEVADSTGNTRSVLVTGRIFGDADQAAAYRDLRLASLVPQVLSRAEVIPLRRPVGLIEPLAMVVYAYPVDGELPTLAAASDPNVGRLVLEELTAQNGGPRLRVASCEAEPVHYNRRHRCMLRYRAEVSGRPPVTFYGKVANDGSGFLVPDVVAAVRAPLAESGVDVPDCLGFRPDLQLTVFTSIRGKPRVAQLLKSRLHGQESPEGLNLESAVETCGRVAARLHSSGLGLGEVRMWPHEIARLRTSLVPIQRLSPNLGDQLNRQLDVLERRGERVHRQPLVQCHGDFTYTQLVFDGAHAGLLDFDDFCQAEPAADLGRFLAYLRYCATKGQTGSDQEPVELAERMSKLFTEAYLEAGGPRAGVQGIELYEATNLIRMAQHAWQNLKSRRLESIRRLLDQRLCA